MIKSDSLLGKREWLLSEDYVSLDKKEDKAFLERHGPGWECVFAHIKAYAHVIKRGALVPFAIQPYLVDALSDYVKKHNYDLRALLCLEQSLLEIVNHDVMIVFEYWIKGLSLLMGRDDVVSFVKDVMIHTGILSPKYDWMFSVNDKPTLTKVDPIMMYETYIGTKKKSGVKSIPVYWLACSILTGYWSLVRKPW